MLESELHAQLPLARSSRRIVPTIKDIGLWGRKIRRAYANMGILGFADVDAARPERRSDEQVAEEFDARRAEVAVGRPQRRLTAIGGRRVRGGRGGPASRPAASRARRVRSGAPAMRRASPRSAERAGPPGPPRTRRARSTSMETAALPAASAGCYEDRPPP